jgi:hypothetical protein
MIRAIPNSCVAVTPSDDDNLAKPGILYVGTGGSVKVTTIAGDTTTLVCPAGYEIKCPVTKVFFTGTDADDLVLYYEK